MEDDDEDDDDDEEDDVAQEERNKVAGWTEDDERNLMELGSSEIERNKRLESLIAKRRAKKLLSMQPRRHYNHMIMDFNNKVDDHQVGPIVVSRATVDDGEDQHQPGSAPTVLLPARNPFDLPYDPQEEKPVLTGGSFEEELFATVQKDLNLLEDSKDIDDHPVAMAVPSFFPKPRAVDKPGFSRFRRESNAEELLKEISREVSEEGIGEKLDDKQESPQEVQLNPIQSNTQDEPNTLAPEEEKSKLLEPDLVSSSENRKEEELGTKEEKIPQMESEATLIMEAEPTQDHLSINKDLDDDQKSSSSSSCDMNIDTGKTEAFRNSVRKALTCLAIPRSDKGLVGKEEEEASAEKRDILYGSSPTNAILTKMEERSFYTGGPHHTQSYSIASDMQVEVSETGSPPATMLEPSSLTDRESLVYDGDVEEDLNSDDEDLWGGSPHPITLGERGTKFKLPDIIEEGSDRQSDGNDRSACDLPMLGIAVTLSPKSILPQENSSERVDEDHRINRNVDVIEPRFSVSSSSSSSSSSGLRSEIQGKSEHLAEYLANLPPGGEGACNIPEEPGPGLSDVREPSAEEMIIHDESNPMLKMDEEKEVSKESKESENSEENSKQSTTASKLEGPLSRETSLDYSSENVKNELHRENKDQGPEQNGHSRRIEKESKPTVEAKHVVHDANRSEVDEKWKEGKVKLLEREDGSRAEALQETVVSSRPSEDAKGNPENGKLHCWFCENQIKDKA